MFRSKLSTIHTVGNGYLGWYMTLSETSTEMSPPYHRTVSYDALVVLVEQAISSSCSLYAAFHLHKDDPVLRAPACSNRELRGWSAKTRCALTRLRRDTTSMVL